MDAEDPPLRGRHDTVLQEVELTLAKRITGCELSSWSGRSVYRGNEIVMGFSGIIQVILTRPIVYI
jgi:hypothetical protein